MKTHSAERGAARSRGFSLFEVLITLAIITLISGGIALAVYKHYVGAKEKATRENARVVRSAVRSTWLEHGPQRCPNVNELIADGMLDEGSPDKDPWGNPYQIACAEGRVTVTSYGPDRQPNTADDIRVP